MKSLRSFPKLISAVLLVCAASLAWSCSDDDTGDDAFIPTFTLPEQPVIKNNYASQNNTITVVASHDVSWTAAKTDEQADWLTITSASGRVTATSSSRSRRRIRRAGVRPRSP